jgi:hydroxymethylbilane synthase
LRGNVDTRLRKLAEGKFDAIVMAAAGLSRLNLNTPHMVRLAPPHFLPAAGQGALGLEFFEDRKDLAELLAFLDDPPTRICVTAERAFLAGLDGGCQVPRAALARLHGTRQLRMQGLVAAVDGTLAIRRGMTGSIDAAAELGQAMAIEIIRSGGRRLLDLCPDIS